MLHPRADWAIFSLSRAGDSDRAPKFKKACRYYGAEAVIADLDDEGRLTLAESRAAIKRLIRGAIGSRRFDFIFTHGANGEYGHLLHKAAHRAVRDLYADGGLAAGKLLFFNYENTGKSAYSKLKPRRNSDYSRKLTVKEFSAKKKVMGGIYGFEPEGIDTGYCTNPEAFKIH